MPASSSLYDEELDGFGKRIERGWRSRGSSTSGMSSTNRMSILSVFRPLTDYQVPALDLHWPYDKALVREDGNIESSETLCCTEECKESDDKGGSSDLPPKQHPKVLRLFRHRFFGVYKRLFSIVFLFNIVGMVVLASKVQFKLTYELPSYLASAASANFTVGILIRQDYIVNTLYRIFWRVPHRAPITFRCILAKIYENGGVHTGATTAGTLWFITLTAVVCIEHASNVMRSPALVSLVSLQLLLLFGIIIFALPGLRSRFHNLFELTHRFCGWTLICTFWAQLFVVAGQVRLFTRGTISIVAFVTSQPTSYFLAITSIHLVYPWLTLRRLRVQALPLSTHAVRLCFEQKLPPCTGISISTSPLLEWHPFAAFPATDSSTGGFVICSSAGDWTAAQVAKPRQYYWTRGLPRVGLLGMARVFARIVLVTTGSGIGPCLSYLAMRRADCIESASGTGVRILWVSPSPGEIFGAEIERTVRDADPLALIVDSRRMKKRPDVVKLAWKIVVESEAEAVFVISNPKLTRKVVYAMEARGVPAFGPIWDS